jgi:hypothetical protein
VLRVPPSVGAGVLPLQASVPVMWLPSMTVGPPTLPVTETAPVTVLPPRTTGPVLPLSDTAPVWVFPAQAAPSYAGTGQVGLQLAGLVHGGGFG